MPLLLYSLKECFSKEKLFHIYFKNNYVTTVCEKAWIRIQIRIQIGARIRIQIGAVQDADSNTMYVQYLDPKYWFIR